MVRKLVGLALVGILAVGCGLPTEPTSTLWEYDPDRTTRAPTTRAATTRTTEANPISNMDFTCKVLEEDVGFSDSWEVSCKLEFDWSGEPMSGEYFEVCFLDEEGFQIDFGNEIADVQRGRNVIHITTYSRPYHSYELFC